MCQSLKSIQLLSSDSQVSGSFIELFAILGSEQCFGISSCCVILTSENGKFFASRAGLSRVIAIQTIENFVYSLRSAYVSSAV